MVAYIPPKQAGKYKAVASNAITNGKPVIVHTDGTVRQVEDNSIAFNIGSNSTFENGNMSAGTRSSDMTFDSNSNKVDRIQLATAMKRHPTKELLYFEKIL